ncbi:MAG: hypothetical protein ACHQ53_09370 [Polyangiales bacterium]
MTEVAFTPIDDDDLTEVFFSQPPSAPPPAIEPWEPRPMSRGQQRAMTATFAMLGFFAAVSICLAAYAELAMVRPAAVGVASLPPLPAPAVGEPVFASLQHTSAPAHSALPDGPAASPSKQNAVPSPRVTAQQIAHDRNTGHPIPRPAAAVPQKTKPAGLLAAATSERPRDLIRRAYIALHKGDARKASDLATQALRLDPTSASGYIALAGARDAVGDRGGALAAFRDCVRYAQDKLVGACKTLAH